MIVTFTWYFAMIAIAYDQAITIIAKYQAKIHEEIPKCQTEERT